MLPVLKTFVAPIFPEPISLISCFKNILVKINPNGIEPKKFVMFTDGWPFETWGDPDYCDTIFLINNPYERNIEAPFGLTVTYED